MSKQIFSALAAATLMAAMAGSALAQNVAVVNGQAIPKERLDTLSQQVTNSGREVTPEVLGKLKELLIAREVFAQEAHKRGLDTTAEFKNQVDLAKQELLLRELFQDEQKKNPVSDAEMKAEYDKFVATAPRTEYRVRHILVEKEDQAKDIIAKIKKGAKFDDLAKKLSKDPGSATKGGDLDWVNPNGVVKEFADVVVALPKGKMSETPVKTQYGYHVIRVEDTRPAQLPKFEDVKPQIAQQMQQQRTAKFQEDLRSKAKVE